jgi:oxygen-independent coproporphyrinogen-3 oxidase
MPTGLYLSVPFCRTKCSYCNFASDVFSRAVFQRYVDRVCADIELAAETAERMGAGFDPAIDSVYLGGGTPTVLDTTQLRRLFVTISQNFQVQPDAEITVECAPGTLSAAVIENLQSCGVNRVSLGVQSFVDLEAASVGRLHKRQTVEEDITRLAAAGIVNMNVDLIAGLPHQTIESWEVSLAAAVASGVPHISVYMLEVDEDSRLGRELIAGGARYHAHFVPDDDMTADFYQQACQMLDSAGIAQYEISNFARTATQLRNNESRHNLKYWTRQPYLGFGVDAHSMLEPIPLMNGRASSPVRVGTAALGSPAERSSAAAGGQRNSEFATAIDRIETGRHQAIRFATPDSLDAYMNREPYTVTPVSVQAAIEESFFLGLRLNRGIDFESLRREFSSEFGPASLSHNSMNCHPERSAGSAVCQQSAQTRDSGGFWESAIQQSVRDGLLEQKATNLRLTARGRLLSNEVFARFLTEETKVGTGHVNPR